jgi:hypothetical protein
MVIEYVPGVYPTVCADEVLPLPQRNAIGVIPPADEAVHVMFELVGTPAHEAVNADAALTNPKESTSTIPMIEIAALFLAKVII